MMVDNNATKSFSNVVSVSGCKNTEISIYPNPTANQLNISGINIGDVIQITNNLGQVVLSRTALQSKETISTDNWAKAIYNIVITDKLGQKTTKKITKQ
jgi:DNA helicase TIP49 (TBP-interacting protein)